MLPVLLSLIAEPVTGLVDTAFIARIGAEALAALGIATTALSTMFWVFNFLTFGTQTQVAQVMGRGADNEAREIISLALLVAWGLGFSVIAVFYALAEPIAVALGAEGDVTAAATTYTQIRLLGAPAVFTALVGFGALRGAQDMRTPSIIAVAINVFNIILDYPLIFGFGFIPALGVGGAALASMMSQYIGAAWLLIVVIRRFGFMRPVHWQAVSDLFVIGGNLFVRTGMLTVYLLIGTRVANQIGVEAGAAHQVVRQIYMFTALSLDAFAVATQSLVGYFAGADNRAQARRAATISIYWSLLTGTLLTLVMLASTNLVIWAMVPAEVIAVFIPVWWISALAQPLNALAFSTDGIHMGTGDYGYLRNAMIAATAVGVAGLFLIPIDVGWALNAVWLITGLWVTVRAAFGLVRVYRAPERSALHAT